MVIVLYGSLVFSQLIGVTKVFLRRWSLWRLLCLLCAVSAGASAQGPGLQIPDCPRLAEGAVVSEPPEFRSQHGVLEVTLHFKYQTTLVGEGPPRYCYISGDGAENPTLRVHPGDQLIIHFQNDLTRIAGTTGNPEMQMEKAATNQVAGDCSGGPVNANVTNLHFHGLDLPPTCHQDDVMRTFIQPGQSFDYRVRIPQNQPPGLYWYHPHVHGFTERQVQGGASGALIVEGIENTEASLRGLRQRLLVLRDEPPTTTGMGGGFAPAWDISINQVPVVYPQYEAAIIQTPPGEKELWRVLNAAADTIFDLQVIVNHVPQELQVVAMDGVPVARSDRRSLEETSILLPPAARAEFIVTTPRTGDQAQLVTRRWDTGPEGDVDPNRPIANIVSEDTDTAQGDARREKSGMVRFPYRKPLDADARVVQRRLYFSQVSPNAAAGETADPDVSIFYYLTVAGQKPARYEMNSPPNIVVHDGDVEDWVIENRAREDHTFHIHQLHFRVIEINGKPVNDPIMRDTIDVPYWTGNGPYPSVELRLDFGNPNIVGTFLYHCHILKHEDMGMMGSIRVLAPGIRTTTVLSKASPERDAGANVTVIATVRARAGGKTVPSGTMQFVVDGMNAGKPVALSDGQASFTTFFGDGSPHEITAIYSGDSIYDESVARPLTVKGVAY